MWGIASCNNYKDVCSTGKAGALNTSAAYYMHLVALKCFVRADLCFCGYYWDSRKCRDVVALLQETTPERFQEIRKDQQSITEKYFSTQAS